MKQLFFLCFLFSLLSLHVPAQVPPQRVCLRAAPGNYQILLRFPSSGNQITLDYQVKDEVDRNCLKITVSSPVLVALVLPSSRIYDFSGLTPVKFTTLNVWVSPVPEWETRLRRNRNGFSNSGTYRSP